MAIDLEVKDVGPVEEFTYTFDQPGIHELRGTQGIGKTTILHTVQRLMDDDKEAAVTKRDGSKRGIAAIGGRTIKVSRKVLREDDDDDILGVGDMNLAELHSPRFKSPIARDKARIANLVHLSGAAVDMGAFQELFSSKEEFFSVIGTEEFKQDGILDVASKIKRSIDTKALEKERQEKSLRDRAQLCQNRFEGIQTDGEHDPEVLQQSLESALQSATRLRQERDSALAHEARAADARVKMEQIEKPDLAVLEMKRTTAELDHKTCQANVEECRAALAKAEQSEREAASLFREVASQLVAAEQISKTIASLQEVINSKPESIPSEADINAAERKIVDARNALGMGMTIRDAIQAREQYATLIEEAKKIKREHESLRSKAQEVFDVVSQAVARIPRCPLSVLVTTDGDFRLVVKTDRSNEELFEDLSDGERWKIIIPLCVGERRIVVIPQSAYGELAPAVKRELHELAAKSGCYILTAVADDGPLRAQLFSV